jgi:hypothetical protein
MVHRLGLLVVSPVWGPLEAATAVPGSTAFALFQVRSALFRAARDHAWMGSGLGQ